MEKVDSVDRGVTIVGAGNEVGVGYDGRNVRVIAGGNDEAPHISVFYGDHVINIPIPLG